MVFGIVGMSYFIYGRKAKKDIFLYMGVVLMLYPYLIGTLSGVVGVGIFLTLAPFVWRKFNEWLYRPKP